MIAVMKRETLCFLLSDYLNGLAKEMIRFCTVVDCAKLLTLSFISI